MWKVTIYQAEAFVFNDGTKNITWNGMSFFFDDYKSASDFVETALEKAVENVKAEIELFVGDEK